MAEENCRLVEAVYVSLAELAPSDFSYSTYRLVDDVTFVHVARLSGEGNPLLTLPAFAKFQREWLSAASSSRLRARRAWWGVLVEHVTRVLPAARVVTRLLLRFGMAEEDLAHRERLSPASLCWMPARGMVILRTVDELHDTVDDFGESLGQAGKPDAGAKCRPWLLASLAERLELRAE